VTVAVVQNVRSADAVQRQAFRQTGVLHEDRHSTHWNHCPAQLLSQFRNESESYPLRYPEHHLAMVLPQPGLPSMKWRQDCHDL